MRIRIATFNVENLGDANLQARKSLLRRQLKRIDADVLLLQEVHAQAGTLHALQELLEGTQYESYQQVFTQQEDGRAFAQRNLVTLSKFPIDSNTQFKHEYTSQLEYKTVTGETDNNKVTWERPALYTQINIDGTPLHIVNIHLKSKNPTNIPGQKIDRFTWKTIPGWAEGFFLSSVRRMGQALEVRSFIDTLFEANKDVRIIVGGDFNDDFHEPAVETILGRIENTGNPELFSQELVPAEFTVPEPSRFSLYHRGQKNMLDHILMSQSLVPYYASTEIHNETLKDESIAFSTDDKFIGSDHAPVIAEFNMS